MSSADCRIQEQQINQIYFYWTAVSTLKNENKGPFTIAWKMNKIFRNKFNKISESLYTENYKAVP